MSPALRLRPSDASAWLALAPALVLMVVFFVLPALRLLQISLSPHIPGALFRPGLTLDNYVRFVGDPFYLGKLWLTLRVCFVVTLFTLIICYPLAYVLVRGRFVGKGLVIGLVLSPLLTNFIVLVFAWVLLLGPAGGVTKALAALAGHPVRLLYAEPGLVIALVHVSIPYGLIPLIASMAQVRHELEEAAISLGAGPWTSFFLVVMPLTLPGALSAAFVVVSIVLSGFAFALFIGGDAVMIVPLLIFQALRDNVDWPLAAAMSLVTFVLVIVVLGATMRLAGLTRAARALA